MSGKRPVQRKQLSASKPGTSRCPEDEVVEPLEFGVIEIKSEVEEVVLTSQFGDLASLVVTADHQGSKTFTDGPSVSVAAPQEECSIGENSLSGGRYSCGLCIKQFGRQAALRKHLESHRLESGRRRTRVNSAVAKHITSMLFDEPKGVITGILKGTKSSFGCSTCGQAFENEQGLREHLSTHSPTKSHVCPKCNHSFASPSNLRKHLRFHLRRLPYVCSFCLQSFETNDLLSSHLLVHKGFVCPECAEVAHSRADLEHHRIGHGVRNDLKCTSCGAGFSSHGELLAHHETHVEPDVFVCSECKTNFQYPSVLRQHMTEHANKAVPAWDEPATICLSENVIDDLVRSRRTAGVGEFNTLAADTDADIDACGSGVQQQSENLKDENDNRNRASSDEDQNSEILDSKTAATKFAVVRHFCDVCRATFETVSELLAHKLADHSPPTIETKGQEAYANHRSKYICLYCSKPFTKRYCLEQHERIHSGERPFSCETCGLTFKQQSQLLKHNMKHSGLKPFVCNYCKKAFSQASYLTEHRRQHTNERPYSCDVCGNRFRTNGALRVHNRQHTGAMPYACDACGRRFKQKANLQKHAQIHTNVRSHNCDTCGKGFTDSQALKRHLVMHTGDRPYVCQLCGKTFPAQSSLTIHMKFHRGERKHKCHLCEKAFVVKSHLNRHLNTHGKRDGSGGILFGQESIAANYIPIDDEYVIADSFQVEEVVQTS